MLPVWKCNAPAITLPPVTLRAFLFLLTAITAFAQGGSALDALKLIPKDAAKRLARIEAREGTPAPERWYLLVFEPAEGRGLREFVVAGGKLVTSRTLSQFAEKLQETEIIGADALKVDSILIAKLASAFAEANGKRAGLLNYELARDPISSVPLWKVTVLDTIGDQLGILTVSATKGAVFAADGFEKIPAGVVIAPPPPPAPPPQPAGKISKPEKKRKR